MGLYRRRAQVSAAALQIYSGLLGSRWYDSPALRPSYLERGQVTLIIYRSWTPCSIWDWSSGCCSAEGESTVRVLKAHFAKHDHHQHPMNEGEESECEGNLCAWGPRLRDGVRGAWERKEKGYWASRPGRPEENAGGRCEYIDPPVL